MAFLLCTKRIFTAPVLVSKQDENDWLESDPGLPLEAIDEFERVLEQLPGDLKEATAQQIAEASLFLQRRALADVPILLQSIRDKQSMYAMWKMNRIVKEEWEEAKARFDVYEEERMAVQEYANLLRPGSPGWGDALFQE